MRTRATKQQIAVTIGLLIAVAVAGWWWSPHIYWSYLLSRNNFKVAPVKVAEMPLSPAPTGWFTCRVGALSFKLPASMAEDAERTLAKTPHALTITTPTRELTLLVPTEAPAEPRPALEQISALLKCSPIQLIANSYRTGSEDFRWTMSRNELARHQLLLNLTSMFPHDQVMTVETTSNDAQEGLLVLHESRSLAKYEWHLNSGRSAGFFMFNATRGELDFDELRSVCQSLTCDESRLGPELSKAQLAVLSDTMQIAPE